MYLAARQKNGSSITCCMMIRFFIRSPVISLLSANDALATLDNMSVIEHIKMGSRSFLAIISTLEVITVRHVHSESKSTQILGTMSNSAAQDVFRNCLVTFPLRQTDYTWLKNSRTQIEDRYIPERCLMFVLSTEPLTVKHIKGGNESVLVVGQMPIESIEMAGSLVGIECHTSAETTCHTLSPKCLDLTVNLVSFETNRSSEHWLTLYAE
jgi:hypothetical protein